MSPHFVRNLVVLLVFGVAILAWILAFTDWFPAIGGILALGGALSWLGFVSRLMKKSRFEELQDRADVAIFDNPRTWRFVALAGALFLAASAFVGTLELRPESGATVPRNVTIHRGDPTRAVRGTVKGPLRVPHLTSWWAPARVHVKLSGYPEVEATVRPWSRETLVVPEEFLRPVVVLTPDKELLDMLLNNPKTLSVRLASRPDVDYRLPNYRGQTVWIGCDEDVDVPASLLDQWKIALDIRQQKQHFHLWSNPLALPDGPPSLDKGERLSIRILTGPNKVYAQTCPTVTPVRTRRDFPQEEEIHGPSGPQPNCPP